MTITGRQIRNACALLGLQRSKLARAVKTVTRATIVRAEAVDDEPPITTAQANAIRQALERAGVAFTADPPGVRLRADPLINTRASNERSSPTPAWWVVRRGAGAVA